MESSSKGVITCQTNLLLPICLRMSSLSDLYRLFLVTAFEANAAVDLSGMAVFTGLAVSLDSFFYKAS